MLSSKKFKSYKQINITKYRHFSKVLENISDFFAEHLLGVCASKFPTSFIFPNLTPVFKNGSWNRKDLYNPINVYKCQSLPKYLKNWSVDNF